MGNTFRLGIAAVGLCVMAGSALAQFPPITEPTKDEAKCQTSTGKALSKLVSSRTKCVQKCLKEGRKVVPGPGPYTDCFAPYGGATATCITDATTLKGADDKARASIVKACMDQPGKDKCPECYGAGLCNSGNPLVTTTGNTLNAFGLNVYCVESGFRAPDPNVPPATPTKDEAKCEDGLAKTLGKFVGSKSKCYQKCNQNMLKGKIAPNSCDAPTPADAATVACIDKAELKALQGLDKVCFVDGVAPSCYDGTVLRPNTSAGWVALAEGAVDGQVPIVGCGSPSGAFLD